MPPKPKRSFILRVPPNSKLGQDLLRDATSGPKTIHQLVLEHFLTFLPKPSLVQPSQKIKETLVIVKDVSSNLQNRGQPRPLVKLLPREEIQQKQETVSLCLKSESEKLVVFEDLNVFHSQEECVSLDPAQQPTSEMEEDSIGEMMLLVSGSNPEGEELQTEPVEDEDHREESSDCDEMDCSMVPEQSPDCQKEERLNTSIPKERKMRNLLVTIENDTPLEELSKYVDINVIALTRNRRTRRWYKKNGLIQSSSSPLLLYFSHDSDSLTMLVSGTASQAGIHKYAQVQNPCGLPLTWTRFCSGKADGAGLSMLSSSHLPRKQMCKSGSQQKSLADPGRAGAGVGSCGELLALNERHYGALISLNREQMALNHGEEQVRLWRRSYNVTPPPIEESHPYYHEIYNDRKYKVCDVPLDQLPRSESLKDVLERLLPYWNERIAPEVLRAWLILEELGQEWVPVESSWRLNERHYGALISLNREQMALNHGEEQVRLWRRSYNVSPPPIEESHPYYHEIYNDRKNKVCDVPLDQLPRSESLKDVLERLLPYWNERIAPEVLRGKTVLISAHGNSCRALLKYLEGISDEEIINITLPTGVPILLELDENLHTVGPHQFLGDQEAIQAAIKKVDDQGKVKQADK
ncbi:hypothetical protein E5288_WYG012583 [Bos mutus]|uniref:phosphoglycerate mutase (2,3-diphosphoglycerate-dependent) n=1 Tax=Bos mutus TaxID=72004 RepID=A0A6B0S569_9CETA|nr:hypothetical protein [Bos mutus]